MSGADRLLPVSSVERTQFELFEIHALQASKIHVDLIRIGTRDIKRVYAAMSAELVLGNTSIESV